MINITSKPWKLAAIIAFVTKRDDWRVLTTAPRRLAPVLLAVWGFYGMHGAVFAHN